MSAFLRRCLIGLALSVLLATVAGAQSGIQVSSDSVVDAFPTGITFQLKAQSASPITQVTLHYGTNARACLDSSTRQSLEFDPAADVDLNWEWDFSKTGVVPPGAQVWWDWTIADAAGNEWVSEKQWHVIQDGAWSWQSLSRDAVTVYWSRGSAAFGAGLLDQALRSLGRLETDMGIRPPGVVQLIVYPSAEFVRAALVDVPEWTGGVAFPEFGLTVLGAAPGENAWIALVIPHELTHLVVGTLVFNCLGVRLPVWLNEGLATAAEGAINPADLAALRAALYDGRLPSLRSLAGGFQVEASRINVVYLYSGQVVQYLLETYGRDAMAALLGRLREGRPIDAALTKTYSLDTDGLDSAWRASEGVAQPAPHASATPNSEGTPVPTLALWTPIVAVKSSTPTVTLAQSSPTRPPATLTAGPVATASDPAPTEARAPSAKGVGLTPILIGLLCALLAGALTAGVVISRRVRKAKPP